MGYVFRDICSRLSCQNRGSDNVPHSVWTEEQRVAAVDAWSPVVTGERFPFYLRNFSTVDKQATAVYCGPESDSRMLPGVQNPIAP